MYKSNKVISIIIPTHNSAQFIHETFNSILKQKINIDIFIADGNSKDNTLEIINEYKKYLNIKVISKSDKGQSDGINKALSYVKTPYFLWLNSDDIILPSMISDFLIFIKDNKRKNFLYISADNFDFNRCKIFKYNFGSVQRELFIKNGIWIGPFPALVWDTELFKSLGGLREDLHYSMDYELVQRFTKLNKNKTINLHINKVLGGFRKHNMGKTTSLKMQKEFQKEQFYLEKEYGISNLKKRFLKYIYKVLNLFISIKFFSIKQKEIKKYLHIIKIKNISLIIK